MNAVQRRLDREVAPFVSSRPQRSGSARPFRGRSAGSLISARFINAATRVDMALPETLEAMARSLRSGSSLRLAIAEAAASAPAPLGEGLAEVAEATGRGRPLNAAIDRWRDATPGDGVPLVAAALGLGAELGGAAARSLDGVAGTLRDRNGVRREVARAVGASACVGGRHRKRARRVPAGGRGGRPRGDRLPRRFTRRVAVPRVGARARRVGRVVDASHRRPRRRRA